MPWRRPLRRDGGAHRATASTAPRRLSRDSVNGTLALAHHAGADEPTGDRYADL